MKTLRQTLKTIQQQTDGEMLFSEVTLEIRIQTTLGHATPKT